MGSAARRSPAWPWRSGLARGAAAVAVMAMAASDAVASPPACMRGDASMYRAADAVVTAAVTSSRRWNAGRATVHLVAKYRVSEVFKGVLDAGEIVIVTDTCLDQPIPEAAMGYPRVERYCLGASNLSLTGVRTEDGRPVERRGGAPDWLLFLDADERLGAPQPTWLEVSRTSFGGGCRSTPNDLPPAQKAGFERLRQHPSP